MSLRDGFFRPAFHAPTDAESIAEAELLQQKIGLSAASGAATNQEHRAVMRYFFMPLFQFRQRNQYCAGNVLLFVFSFRSDVDEDRVLGPP